MKAYFLAGWTLFCMMLVANANAQGNMEDVVYLKNGSVIRGIIIEQIPNKSIKIQTRDGNILAYDFGEVEKITKEESKVSLLENRTKHGGRIGFLAGYGTEDWYKLGFGGRVGGVFGPGMYAGGAFVYHLGTSENLSFYGYSVKVTVRTFYVAAELGYEARVNEILSIRPYTAPGYLSLNVSASSGGTSASESEGRFFVAPGILFDFSVTQHATVGVDGRYVIVTGDLGSDLSAFGIFGSFGFSF